MVRAGWSWKLWVVGNCVVVRKGLWLWMRDWFCVWGDLFGLEGGCENEGDGAVERSGMGCGGVKGGWGGKRPGFEEKAVAESVDKMMCTRTPKVDMV